MLLSRLFGKNYIRKKLLKSTRSTVMKEFLSKPFPNKDESIIDVEIVSVDFETTGLDIQRDNIVSMGVVNISCMGVDLSTSTHQLISQDSKLTEESVVIHNITDNSLLNGVSLDAALPDLLQRLSGKVMLAHNASVELGFLNKMCRILYNTDFVIPVIDTQQLAKRSLDRQNKPYRDNELRLFNLRKEFNMPVYKAHNSQIDAIATAELFLAIANKLSPNRNILLRDCLR